MVASRSSSNLGQREVDITQPRWFIGIQATLASGANREFIFGCNEPGNQRFHQWVDRMLAQA